MKLTFIFLFIFSQIIKSTHRISRERRTWKEISSSVCLRGM